MRKSSSGQRAKPKKSSSQPPSKPNTHAGMIVVSAKELKKRLGKRKTETLLDEYVEAGSQIKPDMAVMAELAEKHKAETVLDVRFRLAPEQYDALAEYFKEKGQPGTNLVKKAIEE